MGISINNINQSGDLSCGAFSRMRTRIAELVSDELADHYKELDELMFVTNPKDVRWKEYDAITDKMYEEADEVTKHDISFLYMPDVEGCLYSEQVSAVLEVCEKVYEEEKAHVYGYIAHDDAFTFGQFVEMLRECEEDMTPLWWN